MPTPRASVAVVFALLLFVSQAPAQDGDGRIPAPIFPTPPLPGTVEPSHVVPDAESLHQHWVALQVLLGLQDVVRMQVEFIHLDRLSFMVEAQAGYEYIVVPTGGVGIRAAYRVYQRQCDAFVVAPGIDLLWPMQTHSDIVTRTDLIFLAATVDFSWIHEFAPHFATELGAQLGADILLANGGWPALPQLSVYAGVRF
jgi:hypothetical protein